MAKCFYCNGNGILDCAICYGMCTNKGVNNCLYCNWEGQKKCKICDGTGEVGNQHSDETYYSMDPYYHTNNGILDSPFDIMIFDN